MERYMSEEKKQNKTIDEKIRYYTMRYKSGKATAEEIKILVRLLYEEKKEQKKAVWILNQCMGQTNDSALQLLYLYEALRAMRSFENELNKTYEVTLYKKLEQLATKEIVHSYAELSVLQSCMEDAVKRRDFACYHTLEQIWKPYWKNDAVWKKRFHTLKKEVQKEELAGRFARSNNNLFGKLNTERADGMHVECNKNLTLLDSRSPNVRFTKKHRIKDENRTRKGIFICFFIACIVFAFIAGLTVSAISTYVKNQKEVTYEENHNMLLTADELSKMEKLQEKYGERNVIKIRYCQLA